MKEMWTGNSLEVTQSGLRGWVTIQKEENKRSRVKRFCVIKGTTLVSHVSDKVYFPPIIQPLLSPFPLPTLHYTTLHYTTLHYTTLHYTTLHTTKLNAEVTEAVDLRDCQATAVAYAYAMKHALKLRRIPQPQEGQKGVATNKRLDIAFGCDYVYLLADTDTQRNEWVEAISKASHIRPEEKKLPPEELNEPHTQEEEQGKGKEKEKEKEKEREDETTTEVSSSPSPLL